MCPPTPVAKHLSMYYTFPGKTFSFWELKQVTFPGEFLFFTNRWTARSFKISGCFLKYLWSSVTLQWYAILFYFNSSESLNVTVFEACNYAIKAVIKVIKYPKGVNLTTPKQKYTLWLQVCLQSMFYPNRHESIVFSKTMNSRIVWLEMWSRVARLMKVRFTLLQDLAQTLALTCTVPALMAELVLAFAYAQPRTFDNFFR